MKVYTEMNNLQLELIRYSKKMLTLFMFSFAKRRIRAPNAEYRKFRTQTTSAPFLTVWAASECMASQRHFISSDVSMFLLLPDAQDGPQVRQSSSTAQCDCQTECGTHIEGGGRIGDTPGHQ